MAEYKKTMNIKESRRCLTIHKSKRQKYFLRRQKSLRNISTSIFEV